MRTKDKLKEYEIKCINKECTDKFGVKFFKCKRCFVYRESKKVFGFPILGDEFIDEKIK